MSVWCDPGWHQVSDRDAAVIRVDTLPGGTDVPVHACRTCVERHGLVPRLPTGSMFVGRPGAAPIAPGRPA